MNGNDPVSAAANAAVDLQARALLSGRYIHLGGGLQASLAAFLAQSSSQHCSGAPPFSLVLDVLFHQPLGGCLGKALLQALFHDRFAMHFRMQLGLSAGEAIVGRAGYLAYKAMVVPLPLL